MTEQHDISHQALMDRLPFFTAWFTPDYRLISDKEIAGNKPEPSCSPPLHCYEIWGLKQPCTGCPMPGVLHTQTPADLTLPATGQRDWPVENGFWQVRMLPVKALNDQMTILEIACNITALKEAREDLEIFKSRLRDTQKLAHIGHWELYHRTGELFWSEEIYRIFEIDPSSFEASYEAFLKATHPEDREKINQAYTRSLTTGKPYSIEHRLLMKDGRIKYVQERCKTEYDAHRNPVKSIGTVQDITENKRIEAENKALQEKILQVQKMESVGRLAGGVAHDFNNMLFVILGNLELVMEGINKNDTNYEALSEIQTAAKRSADLTRQLLAFSRQQTISPRLLSLNTVIDDMIKMLVRLIGEDIELRWIPGKNLGRVMLDPTQVDQILVNLCVNSRDAITGSGKITIETHMVCIGESECRQRPGFKPGEFVTLEVSDNGCGMEKAVQDRLFEPFFTTKKTNEGTGLGLATTYGIVKQNNGFINVYSEPGNGTTFRIYFRTYKGDDSNDHPLKDTGDAVKGGCETILLVDDEAMILNFCEKTLKKLGYQVLKADSPHKALSIANRHGSKIDLLLTDVIMAKMNGKGLADILQRDFPSLKILYMSGYTANVIAHRGILDEGVMFLQKPFSKEALAQKIRDILSVSN
ncbi:ATP-binding protein [uncultured Desulfobacter sp.]|uniref:PAS domain-containing hybrid sensor histidine kinase/response regulator n=1 Tax=uncultured Desulfobacter sp. TaxID=240139 RepID=UPI002AA90973|nr:ATP-binding protein [uncultured Desulfobacter sp.]